MPPSVNTNEWKNGMLFKSVIALMVLCLLAYWPLTFHIYSLKNDAIIYFLPVRYAISDAISNHYWPFWTPYLNLGYPLHADMQSGVWNPFVQIISLFGPYTLKTLQWETILYIYLSGVGMLFLLKYFGINPLICLLIAASYMLCGFISDSAQFLYWICGAAFLPFVILFFHRLYKNPTCKNAIYFGTFFYLYFVTAYPGEFILLSYFLLAFLFWLIITTKTFADKKTLVLIFKHFFLATIIFIVLSLPAIISYITFIQTANRGHGVSYQLAMSNSLHPLLLFSHITPIAAWKAPFASLTDPLGRNSFFGIIPFLLLIVSLITPSSQRFIKFLKWSFIVFLLFSFGEFGGIRTICYYILPLMDTFRHPSLARLFYIFFGCLLAAFMCQKMLLAKISLLKIQTAWYLFFLLLVSLFIVGISGNHTIVRAFHTIIIEGINTRGIKSVLDEFTFSDVLLINLVIELPFVIASYFFLIKKLKLRRLLITGLINCFIHTALYQPFSVVSTYTVSFMEKNIEKVKAQGFPPPDLNATVLSNSEYSPNYINFFGPINIYRKRIGHSYHNLTPSNLKSQTVFWEKEKLRELIFSYPIFYRADSLVRGFTIVPETSDKRLLFLDTISQNISGEYKSSIKYNISFLAYSPNKLEFYVTSSDAGYYCLQQNIHPNWILLIDGKQIPIEKGNLTYITFPLQKGKHHVLLHYDHKLLRIISVCSSTFLFSIIIFILYELLKRSSIKNIGPA